MLRFAAGSGTCGMMGVRRLVLMGAVLALFVAAVILDRRTGDSQYPDEFLVSTAAAAPEPDTKVGFKIFHDRLAPYGQWMNDGRWGAVWRPNVRHGFWPYRQGHWDMTTEYGVAWVSDYPWGTIPFHYGRWFYDPERGWLWVPGYVWAPAWVIWRAGSGKIGWLPIPPWIDYDGSGKFPDDWDDGYGYAEYGLSPSRFASLWCFVDASDLYAPNLDYFVIGPGHNIRFVGRTQGWTRYGIVHGRVIDLSIEPARFRATFAAHMHAQRSSNIASQPGPIVDHRTVQRTGPRKHERIIHPPTAARALAAPPIAAHPVSRSVPAHATIHAIAHPSVTSGPAPRPPAVHASPAHIDKTPRVYTHTEVVPYHPDSMPPTKISPDRPPD